MHQKRQRARNAGPAQSLARASTSRSNVSSLLAKLRSAQRAAPRVLREARRPLTQASRGKRREPRLEVRVEQGLGRRPRPQRRQVAQQRAKGREQEGRVLGLLQRFGRFHAPQGILPGGLFEERQELLAHPGLPAGLVRKRRPQASSGESRPERRRLGRQAELLLEPLADHGPREGTEAQPLAARADRGPQPRRGRRDEDHVRAGRRLLQVLEQRVLGGVVHGVGVVDHEDTSARLERRARDLPHQVPHLVDADLRLAPRPARARQPPALGEHEVGVKAEVAPDVLVGVPVGLLAQLGEPRGADRRGHALARPALPARLRRGRLLAERRLRHRERQRLLPDTVGAVEQQRGGQAIALERAGEHRAEALVTPDLREPQAASPDTKPRPTSARHRLSNTASAEPRPSMRSQRAGSSATSSS